MKIKAMCTDEYFGIDYEIIWDVASNYLPWRHTQAIRALILNGRSKLLKQSETD
ncbi:MAG: hypothetical protein K9H49_14200 [Bacteroidales bacterium]|nr:hypothetical protein [Bacteroidales bacterium]MCF8390846.1 hypothetical protein [Bacteroidales bacterium]